MIVQVTAKEANVKYDMLGVAYTLSAFKKNLYTTHSQMLGKIEYTLPAKF